MKHTRYLLILSLLMASLPLFAAKPLVRIESPEGGFLKDPIVKISGVVENFDRDFATLIYNGIAQRVGLDNEGRFSVKMVLAHGDGLIEVQARNAQGLGRARVNFFADVPRVSLKIVLVWDSDRSDMDLWVTGPDGERVYYGNKTGKAGGQLDVDVVTGYGPETFTCAMPQAGTWQVQVQNYNPGNEPLTTMRLDLILFEGTDREERETWHITSFRRSEVVNVASFVIGEDGRLDRK